MGALREAMIGAGLAAFRLTGAHRLLAPLLRGQGAILALHRVGPSDEAPFAPNRGLVITPAHLDAVLGHLRRHGIALVSLDDLVHRLDADQPGYAVALTFDDGYRDTLDEALPVLARHGASFTTFVTTGFADRTARLWWLELERVIEQRDRLDVSVGGHRLVLPCRDPREKGRAFAALATRLRLAPPAAVAATLDALGCEAAAGRALVAELCLDWAGIAHLAAHPLATIGCHTVTHPCLAALDDAAMRRELAAARDAIASRLGRPVHHLAYPYGGAGAAGAREFGVAADLGFAGAVTTRPGVLRRRDAAHPTALPRLSLNGLWPRLDVLDILLSGAPFALRDLDPRVLVSAGSPPRQGRRAAPSSGSTA